MTIVDSADSVLMLYSYAGFPEKGFALFEKPSRVGEDTASDEPLTMNIPRDPENIQAQAGDAEPPSDESSDQTKRLMRVKRHTMSDLSIFLTLVSILVAFRYITVF